MVYTRSVYSNAAQVSAPQRHIPLEGAYNVRDVGGYATKDGKRIRWNTLFRADGLHTLTHEDQRRLLGRDIRKIIDLRFRTEAERAPNVFAQSSYVSYVHQPLHEDQLAPIANPNLPPQDLPQTPAEYYRMVLDKCGRGIKQVFDHLTAPRTFPVLIHCTAGKDRTGIITALVLGAVGVPDETIIEDYALTTTYATPLLIKLEKQAHKSGIDVEWHRRMLECNPKAMAQTLNHLNMRYGGAEAYLLRNGVLLDQVERLRAELYDPSAVGLFSSPFSSSRLPT
jgi:protein-tyrosine phosphatase